MPADNLTIRFVDYAYGRTLWCTVDDRNGRPVERGKLPDLLNKYPTAFIGMDIVKELCYLDGNFLSVFDNGWRSVVFDRDTFDAIQACISIKNNDALVRFIEDCVVHTRGGLLTDRY